MIKNGITNKKKFFINKFPNYQIFSSTISATVMDMNFKLVNLFFLFYYLTNKKFCKNCNDLLLIKKMYLCTDFLYKINKVNKR